MFVYQHYRMHHRVNDCLNVLMNVYEYVKMLNEFMTNENVDSLK